MITWFAKNPVAANLLMFGIIFAGFLSFNTIQVKTFPDWELDVVTINTAFRGATPQNTEDGITLRVEEAIADLEGIYEITSSSSEGLSSVRAEIDERYDPRDLLDDIKVRIDGITTLPELAEKPVVSLNVRTPNVIYVAVQGNVGTKTLSETANKIREGLQSKSNISNVELQGVADYEMNIEIAPQTLDDFNISLEQIGRAIQNGSRDISAGNIKTRNGDILVRSDGQAYTAEEFAAIPIITNSQGNPVTLGQIANIDDGFEEKSLITTFNGKPAIMIQVKRAGDQSAIQVAEDTKQYISEIENSLPNGISIDYWDNDAAYLKTRLNAVLNSALYGGLLVMLMLSLFLRPAVAFWVFLGIPVSFMGAFLFMPHVGASFNIISLFAFILVIGIVVDDAIVTGESIYRKLREGVDPQQAAILGTKEIAVPVTFGILSTVVAFLPLLMIGKLGLGFMAAQMPVVVIPILLMSLVESKLILPSHMQHVRLRKVDDSRSKLTQIQQSISHGLESFIVSHYQPFLKKCLANKAICMSALLAFSSIVVTAALTGHISYSSNPRIESQFVRISITMPETTGFDTTNQHVKRISDVFLELQKKYTDAGSGESVIVDILATSGSSGRTIKPNIGSVQAYIQSKDKRVIDVSPSQIAREARAMVGEIPGAQSLSVRAHHFGNRSPINIELSGDNSSRMFEMIDLIKQQLKTYPTVFDIQDNYSGGKEELELTLNDRAVTLGFSLSEVASQVRNSVFGFQAQRIQRGRDELRVMVRFPLEYRSSLEDLTKLPIKVPTTGEEVQLSEIVEISSHESPSTLYRVNRRSIVNITADVDKDIGNAAQIRSELKTYLDELQQSFPDVSFSFVGEAKDLAETNNKLMIGLIVTLFTIYALLAIPFKSYGQPLIIMSIIPFSVIGSVVGHIITFQNLSMLSIFGMLALIGVVVNDSLVLVDYINKQRRKGMEVLEAVSTAAVVRFRPVFLTSVTTFVGLIPILLDNSQQAKWLKPMATSLGFGILFASVITLVIVPINYLLARRFKHACRNIVSDAWSVWLEFWNREDSKRV